jgi:hypothetical protein
MSPPYEGGFTMVSALVFYALLLVGLLWLCVMLHWAPIFAEPNCLTFSPMQYSISQGV